MSSFDQNADFRTLGEEKVQFCPQIKRQHKDFLTSNVGIYLAICRSASVPTSDIDPRVLAVTSVMSDFRLTSRGCFVL